jgi:hypothetical protein
MFDQDLDRAIGQFNVDAYLRSLGLHVSGTREEAIVNCPRCHAERKLYVNRRTKRFICFKCKFPTEFRGGLVGLVMGLSKCSIGDAITLIRERAGGNGGWSAPQVLPTPATTDVALPETVRRLKDPEDLAERRYWEYLTGRRLSQETIRAYGMGYARVGLYAGRVFVPVLHGSLLVSWVARDVTGTAERKVLTPPGNAQGQTLFNLDAVAASGEAVVVEGVFDALRAPDTCVAAFGKRLTQAQKVLLRKSGIQHLTLAFDADAWVETTKIAWEVSTLFRSVRIARLPEGMDPSDMEESHLRRVLEAARPVEDWHRLAAVVEGAKA